MVVWLSPPPWDMQRNYKPDIPPEWVHVYARMAADLGFFYPTGPAYHLDLYSLALGNYNGQLVFCKSAEVSAMKSRHMLFQN